MPRTNIAAQNIAAVYAKSPTVYTYTAADVANKNLTTLTGSEILVARNVDGAAAHAITITSTNLNNRTGDSTQSLGANAFAVFQNFPTAGWQQSDGKLYFEADNVNIEFAVLKLP